MQGFLQTDLCAAFLQKARWKTSNELVSLYLEGKNKMKNYRKAVAVLVMLMSASPALAGIMQTGVTEQAPAPDSMMIVLDLLQSLLF
jgi:hypothetical protein